MIPISGSFVSNTEHFAQIRYLHSVRMPSGRRAARTRVRGKHLWEGTSIPSTLSSSHSAK